MFRILIWFANTKFGARLSGWIFAKMSFIIPVERLRETKTLIAFHHPKPSYSFHVLIVPKKAVKTLADLDPNDSAFLTDLFFYCSILGE